MDNTPWNCTHFRVKGCSIQWYSCFCQETRGRLKEKFITKLILERTECYLRESHLDLQVLLASYPYNMMHWSDFLVRKGCCKGRLSPPNPTIFTPKTHWIRRYSLKNIANLCTLYAKWSTLYGVTWEFDSRARDQFQFLKGEKDQEAQFCIYAPY